ncbi:MAG: hypothetical protein V4596_04515 [Bdellovibrionota bacterium]
MKKIGDIMEEMGFNANSTPSSKAAFIKYLAKQAYNVDLQIPEIYQTEEECGDATLDSFLNRESPAEQKAAGSNVESIFKKKSSEELKQLEFKLEEPEAG